MKFKKTHFSKKDLKVGDVLTLRNGSVGIFDNKKTNIDCLLADNIEDDLTNNGFCGKKLDIVKVERPIKYETVFKRTIKEMTLEEVCEKLGYEVKIIKGDK